MTNALVPASASLSARPQADWRQGVLAALVASLPLVAFMALPAAMPVLMRHFAGHPGASVLVPMLAAAPSACIALLSPAAGFLADRFGRRRTTLVSVAAFTLAGVAPLLTDDLDMLIGARLLMGVANAGLMTLGSTLLADYFAGEARRRWLGFSGVIGSALITIALFSGGVLASWSWRGPLLAPLIGLPILLLGLRWLYELAGEAGPAEGETPARRFPWSTLAVLSGLTLLSAIWFYVEAIQIGLVLDADAIRPEALIALVSAAISIGYPIGAMIYSRIAHRYSQPTLFITGCVMTGAGLIGVGLGRTWPLIAALGFVQQIGGGFMLTLLLHQGQERFAFRHRARVMGVWTSAFFAGQFVSPLAVHLIGAVAGGLRPAVSVMGAIALAAGLALTGLYAVSRIAARRLPDPLPTQPRESPGRLGARP